MEQTETWAVVVAAGSGLRYGGPKHSLLLNDEPLWSIARDRLLAGGVGNVVVVGDVPGGIPGGRRRQDSVNKGLEAVPDSARWILVHDAARPAASADLVRHVISRLQEGDVDGVIPAVPARDTMKQVEGELVVGTVDRVSLVAVQTPQGFGAKALRRAHQFVDVDVTDDAQMIELSGGKVVVIPGEPENTKVTFAGDLEGIAETL
jgi:2-C-methyl-D-erythritol 4-phosphate cytidylyltransferase/2-C-methyl-D-erythritol 2,4-cyclodiphosphate synthase